MDYQQYIYYFDEMNRVNVNVFCTVAGKTVLMSARTKIFKSKILPFGRLDCTATEGNRGDASASTRPPVCLQLPRAKPQRGFRLQHGKGAPPVRNHPSAGDRRRPLTNAAVLEQADTLLLHQDPQDRKSPEDGMVVAAISDITQH